MGAFLLVVSCVGLMILGGSWLKKEQERFDKERTERRSKMTPEELAADKEEEWLNQGW